MIKYVLFDMDNCLYPASAGLCHEMDRRISSFVADLLSMTYEEAAAARKDMVKTYGTTQKWLENAHNFTDIDAYNNAIHPENVKDFLEPSKELVKMLSALPCGASILTNAPKMHADRVLGYLEITDFFDHILELGFSGTMGKPHEATYKKALEICGANIETTLFLDDVPAYLFPFRKMGGEVLLVDESGKHSGVDLPVITDILQLPGHISGLSQPDSEKDRTIV